MLQQKLPLTQHNRVKGQGDHAIMASKKSGSSLAGSRTEKNHAMGEFEAIFNKFLGQKKTTKPTKRFQPQKMVVMMMMMMMMHQCTGIGRICGSIVNINYDLYHRFWPRSPFLLSFAGFACFKKTTRGSFYGPKQRLGKLLRPQTAVQGPNFLPGRSLRLPSNIPDFGEGTNSELLAVMLGCPVGC